MVEGKKKKKKDGGGHPVRWSSPTEEISFMRPWSGGRLFIKAPGAKEPSFTKAQQEKLASFAAPGPQEQFFFYNFYTLGPEQETETIVSETVALVVWKLGLKHNKTSAGQQQVRVDKEKESETVTHLGLISSQVVFASSFSNETLIQ